MPGATRAIRRAVRGAAAEVAGCGAGVRRAVSHGDDACATPRDTDARDERPVDEKRFWFPSPKSASRKIRDEFLSKPFHTTPSHR